MSAWKARSRFSCRRVSPCRRPTRRTGRAIRPDRWDWEFFSAKKQPARCRTAEKNSQSHRSGRIARPVRRVGRLQGDTRRQENLLRAFQADIGYERTVRAHPRCSVCLRINATFGKGEERGVGDRRLSAEGRSRRYRRGRFFDVRNVYAERWSLGEKRG